MQLGRLGAWYSTDKLGGPRRSRQFVGRSNGSVTTRCGIRNRAATNRCRSAGFMLANTTKLKLGSSIAIDLRARRLHLAPWHAVAASAVRRPLHPRPRRQPRADGRGRARPQIREAGAGDARLSRWHHQGRGRVRELADRDRRAGPADAEAVGASRRAARCPTTPRRSTRPRRARSSARTSGWWSSRR